MGASLVTLEVKKILSMSPATGVVKAWSSRQVQGPLEVIKKTNSVVRFKIGEEHFLSSAKDFRDRKCGSIFVV